MCVFVALTILSSFVSFSVFSLYLIFFRQLNGSLERYRDLYSVITVFDISCSRIALLNNFEAYIDVCIFASNGYFIFLEKGI